MKTVFWKVAGLLLFLSILVSGMHYAERAGYNQGYAAAELTGARVDNNRYANLLSRSSLLLQESNQVSDLLLQRIQQQAELSRKTTEELNHALAKTAANRINCRLPADGLQQLQAARERAATAVSTYTHTSNTQSALPSTHSSQQ